MQQPEITESETGQSRPETRDSAAAATVASLPGLKPSSALSPQTDAGSCPTCGSGANATGIAPFVYAIGRIEPRFPTPSVEKEFAQATGRENTRGLTDRQALHAVLSKSENRYLVRQLCWVVTIGGLETYILHPRDPVDFSLLVESVRSEPSPMDLDVVIGRRGPIAPQDMCNGLMLPIVAFDQLYSFDRDTLLKAIPPPPSSKGKKEFTAAAAEVLERVMQMTDNAGATDEHRALNYLAVRYPAIYATAADAYSRNSALTAVDVRPSPVSAARTVVDVIFSFTDRATDVVEKFFVRVDVTEMYPFLVTKMSPYYDCSV